MDDDGYVFVGKTSSFGSGTSDVWLVCIDSNGRMKWNKTYGGINEESGYSIILSSDYTIVITGFTNSLS